jgi:hypothetical protein
MPGLLSGTGRQLQKLKMNYLAAAELCAHQAFSSLGMLLKFQ